MAQYFLEIHKTKEIDDQLDTIMGCSTYGVNLSEDEKLKSAISTILSDSELFDTLDTQYVNDNGENFPISTLVDAGCFFTLHLPDVDLIDLHTITEQLNQVYPKSVKIFQFVIQYV